MLEENGRLLRVTREALGYTWADVEDAIKVREYYLKQLEEGDLSGMPGRVYALGFAETYAKFLKLDPSLLLADIKEYYAKNSSDVGYEAYVSGKKVVQAVAEKFPAKNYMVRSPVFFPGPGEVRPFMLATLSPDAKAQPPEKLWWGLVFD